MLFLCTEHPFPPVYLVGFSPVASQSLYGFLRCASVMPWTHHLKSVVTLLFIPALSLPLVIEFPEAGPAVTHLCIFSGEQSTGKTMGLELIVGARNMAACSPVDCVESEWGQPKGAVIKIEGNGGTLVSCTSHR